MAKDTFSKANNDLVASQHRSFRCLAVKGTLKKHHSYCGVLVHCCCYCTILSLVTARGRGEVSSYVDIPKSGQHFSKMFNLSNELSN